MKSESLFLKWTTSRHNQPITATNTDLYLYLRMNIGIIIQSPMQRLNKCLFKDMSASVKHSVTSPFKTPEPAVKKRKLEEGTEEITPFQSEEIEQEPYISKKNVYAVLESSESMEDKDATSSTESLDHEDLTREEIQKWLAVHGTSFFHVEVTKFLVAQKKREEKASQKRK